MSEREEKMASREKDLARREAELAQRDSRRQLQRTDGSDDDGEAHSYETRGGHEAQDEILNHTVQLIQAYRAANSQRVPLAVALVEVEAFQQAATSMSKKLDRQQKLKEAPTLLGPHLVGPHLDSVGLRI